MTSAIAATPIADTLSEALRAKPLRMLLLALLSVWLVAAALTGPADAAGCGGTPLTVAGISLPELPDAA
jgi:hypothetical protein